MSRWGGRFAPNQENELRRLVKEPVQTWKREWVQPNPSKPFKILKYVKTGSSIDFTTQAAFDTNPDEIEVDPEPEQPPAEAEDEAGEQDNDGDNEGDDDDDEDEAMGDVTEAKAGAEVKSASATTPASALPAHMQAEADAAAAANASASPTTSADASLTLSTSSSSADTSTSTPEGASPAAAKLDEALMNVAAGIPASSVAALTAAENNPGSIIADAADATESSEAVGGGGVQVASELNPPPDGVTPAATTVAAPVTVTTLEPDGAQGGDEAVPTRKEVRLVAGVKTEVLVQAFTDRILVLVTQLGRVGCLIQATTTAPASYVPTSSLSSRSLYEDLDADDLSQDPNPADSALGGDVAVSTYTQPPQTPSGAALPTPLPSTALLSLFGTPPAGQDTLFSLYVSQVAAIVHAQVGLATTEQRPGGGETRPHHVNNPLRSDAEPDPRPVVVGLALKRLSTSAGIGEEDDEVDVLDPGERGRFLEIMDMVLACRVW